MNPKSECSLAKIVALVNLPSIPSVNPRIAVELYCLNNIGSSKNSVEDVTTEDTETPSAARKAADEDRALRRKPPSPRGSMKDR